MLWARIEGLDSGAVRRALWEERSLVKTWAMRGTLHLLPASELARWQAVFSKDSSYPKQLVEGITEALDSRILTREALADEVSRITGSAGPIGLKWTPCARSPRSHAGI